MSDGARTADAGGSTVVRARLTGLDVARAIALIGMVAAHVGDDGTRGADSDGWHWLWVTHGRPSALFAVLAGVSISLMLVRRAGGDWRDATDADVSHTRWRVAVRGAVLILAGYAMDLLNTPVDVILTNLGLMFLLALPALRWSTRALLVSAGAILAVGAAVVHVVATTVTEWGWPELPILEKFISHHYPAIAWMAYILAGLAIGRLALRSSRVQAWLAGAGVALAAISYTAGAALSRSQPGGPDAQAWFTVEPHSYSAFEMAGNLGVAAAVIALCLAVADRWPRVVWPLAAAGSMAFTLYVVHVIAVAIVGPAIVYEPTNSAFLVMIAALIAFACVWRWLVGQGPLERLMSLASMRVADSIASTQVVRTT